MGKRSQARKRQLYGKDSSGHSNTGGATATLPVNTAAPAVTGTPAVRSTLTCSNGTWTGNPAPTYTKQWRSTSSPIAGATGATYVVAAGDAGKIIDCQVTATNAAGSVSRTSNAVSIP